MPVSAETVRLLLEAGVAADKLVGIIASIDQDMAGMAPATAAPAPMAETAHDRRKAWDRNRKREKAEERKSGGNRVEIPPEKSASPAPSPNGPSPSPAPQPHPLNPPTPHPAGKPAPAPAAKSPDDFERFWAVYPSRGDASNPKKPARERFERAVKAGADPEHIIAGAARYAAIETKRGTLRTDKIAQAVTWLNQQRWADYPEPVATVTPSTNGRVFVKLDSPQWWAWRDHRKAIGKPPASASWNVERQADGWWFDSEWPPGALDAKKAPAEEPTPNEGMF